ncbi:MAG: hypothetical protein ACRD3M_19305 [Thermoanaerobaculia bacterium]
MNGCAHPLDPIDIEALASGSDPVVDPDAAAHASQCGACSQAVRRAEGLERLLGSPGTAGLEAPADLAQRVLRIRPFSRAERRSLAVWRAPLLLLGGLTLSGVALIAGPVAGAREQIGLVASALASLVGLLRACGRWALDLSRGAPEGLGALSQLAPSSAGWAALLLLLPAVYALRGVLAGAFTRR